MESSENSIQPARPAPERPGAPRVLAGTVTDIKVDGGARTLEVQYAQGKVRFQAEGEFQVGDKVRLSFAGNGTLQVEKEKGIPPKAQGDWLGAGYTLPRNMSALKDLRAFEENVIAWMASEPPDAEGVPRERESLARLSLPQLMLKAMEKSGGRDLLAEALPGLHRGVMSALVNALEQTKGDAGLKSALLDLLRSQGGSRPGPDAARGPDPGFRPGTMAGPEGPNLARASEAGKPAGQSPGGAAAAGGAIVPGGARTASGAKAPDGARSSGAEPFLPAEAGAGHSPWFGRIMDRQQADGFLTPGQRLQFGGAGGPPKGEPMYRYLMDMGGRTLEVYSSQAREPGEFTDFGLDRQGGRIQARFTDPAAGLPAGLRTAMAGASGDLRQGMQLASRYLQDFRDEPYYGRLVEDFGAVLAQSGRLEARTPDGRPAIPDQKEMEGLLKLFVAFPRDARQPERQARVWGEAVQDPQAVAALLKNLRPDQDASLLRSGTALHLAAQGKVSEAAAELMAAAAERGESPEATAAWLRKTLPEAFTSKDLIDLARDASPFSTAGREHEAAKFLLQAVSHALPREDQIQEGRPAQFYFYQGQEWRNLQVTWERGGGGQGKGKAGPKAPLQVKVETRAKHMGAVNVSVSWDPKGARLDFRNQFHDVRDLLAASLAELEKSLALMDFRVASWSYDLLPADQAASLPDPGWTRPASLSDGANLDLFG